MKQKHESLRQQIGTLSFQTKDAAKLTKEVNELKTKIANIKAKEDKMVENLTKEQEDILSDIKSHEIESKHLNK